jgi:hypothetical protein
MSSKTRQVGPNWHQVNPRNWVFTYDLERLRSGHPEVLIGAVFERGGSFGTYGLPGAEEESFETLKEAKNFVERETIWYPEMEAEEVDVSNFRSRLGK